MIVDLAAERGGNCELTKPGKPSSTTESRSSGREPALPTATHASQLFSKNVQTFLLNMVKEGELHSNMEDPIVAGSLLARGGGGFDPTSRNASSPKEDARANIVSNFFIFLLATFLGLEVIRRVSPLLHTPLMSLTNAISAISLGRLFDLLGRAETTLSMTLRAASRWSHR